MRGTYLLYDIITWPTMWLVYWIEKWHYWLWGYAHYRYGKGPRIYAKKRREGRFE